MNKNVKQKYKILSDWNLPKISIADSFITPFLAHKVKTGSPLRIRMNMSTSPSKRARMVDPSPSSIPVSIPEPNSLSPTSYDPRFTVTKPTIKVSSFSKTRRFNELQREEDSNSYRAETEEKDTRKNWFFKSTSKRIQSMNHVFDSPGPGYYHSSKYTRTRGFAFDRAERSKFLSTDPHRPFVGNPTVPPIGSYMTHDDQIRQKRLENKFRPKIKNKLKS